MKTDSFLTYLQRLAPEETALENDPVGFQISPSLNDIRSVIVCLDATSHVIEVAEREGAHLVITHHPLIYTPLKNVLPDQPVNSAVVSLIRAGIGLYSMHTNWDTADGGINDTLATILDLTNIKRLGTTPETKMARIGELSRSLPADIFVGHVLDKLGCAGSSSLRECKPVNGSLFIKSVAVCGGAGSFLMPDVIAAGADAFVTADVRHHEFIDAASRGILLIDAGHEATEAPGMQRLAKQLGAQIPELSVRFVANWP